MTSFTLSSISTVLNKSNLFLRHPDDVLVCVGRYALDHNTRLAVKWVITSSLRKQNCSQSQTTSTLPNRAAPFVFSPASLSANPSTGINIKPYQRGLYHCPSLSLSPHRSFITSNLIKQFSSCCYNLNTHGGWVSIWSRYARNRADFSQHQLLLP